MFVGVSAKMSNVEIGAGVTWIYCEVALTFKQCEKYEGGTSGTIATSSDSHEDSGGSGGGSSGGGGGGKKSSGKKKPKPIKHADTGLDFSKEYQTSKDRTKETDKAKDESSKYGPTHHKGSTPATDFSKKYQTR